MSAASVIGMLGGLSFGLLVFIGLQLARIADDLADLRRSVDDAAPKKPYVPEPRYHPFYGHEIHHP